MIQLVFRFVRGFVGFCTVGQYPERLINVLARGGAEIWGIKRQDGKITACMSIKNYRKMPRLRQKCGVKTRIISRCGLPFILKKYRLRIGAAVGVLVFFAVQGFLLTRIWNIEVVSNGEVDITSVLSAAKECGLYEGVKKKSLDTETLRSKMILALSDVAWMSINVEGVKATVNVIKSKPVKPEAAEPCNLVAELDGVVTAIEVRRGKIEVALGQTVKKGELLVSGFTEFSDGSTAVCHADGAVYARVEREFSVFEPYSFEVREYGESFNRYALSVFGVNVPLYLGGVQVNAETETVSTRYEKKGNYLPVVLTRKTYRPYDTVTVEQSISEATKRAEEKMTEMLKNTLFDTEYTVRSVKTSTDVDGVTLNVTVSCDQNIAKENFLLISEDK